MSPCGNPLALVATSDNQDRSRWVTQARLLQRIGARLLSDVEMAPVLLRKCALAELEHVEASSRGGARAGFSSVDASWGGRNGRVFPVVRFPKRRWTRQREVDLQISARAHVRAQEISFLFHHPAGFRYVPLVCSLFIFINPFQLFPEKDWCRIGKGAKRIGAGFSRLAK